jgi:hypothetical protein
MEEVADMTKASCEKCGGTGRVILEIRDPWRGIKWGTCIICFGTGRIGDDLTIIETKQDINGWMPIKTFPVDGASRWITHAPTGVMVVGYRREGLWRVMWSHYKISWTPTHWQPLPKPVNDQTKKGFLI